MIKPIKSRYLSTEEVYVLALNTQALIKSSDIEEQLKTKLLTCINKNILSFEEALNRNKKNPLTISKKEKDIIRDHYFLGLRSYIESMTYHWEESINTSAHSISEVIERHGHSLHNLGYNEETALLNSLIAELQQEPGSTHIATTGAQSWLAKLAEAQIDFEKTKSDAIDHDSIEKPSINKTKTLVIKDLNDVLNYIGIEEKFNETPAITDLISKINQNILSVVSIAKARNTRQRKGELVEENTEE